MHSQKNPFRVSLSSKTARHVVVFCAAVATATVMGTKLTAQHSSTSAAFSTVHSDEQVKRDSMTITLEPLKRVEVKLEMKKGQKAEFTWKSDEVVTYNLHGEGPDAPGGKAHTYKRGESKAETGEVVALFDGIHGWSWRNTSEKPVKISVTAWGQFQALRKM